MNILLQGHIAVSGESYLKEVADPHWNTQTWTPDTHCETAFAEMAAVANVMVSCKDRHLTPISFLVSWNVDIYLCSGAYSRDNSIVRSMPIHVDRH